METETAAIRERVREIVSNVTRISLERIGDHTSFRDDLGLDSLSMLEIGVDVDYAFSLGVEDLDKKLGNLPTVEHVVEFVERLLRERQPA